MAVAELDYRSPVTGTFTPGASTSTAAGTRIWSSSVAHQLVSNGSIWLFDRSAGAMIFENAMFI